MDPVALMNLPTETEVLIRFKETDVMTMNDLLPFLNLHDLRAGCSINNFVFPCTTVAYRRSVPPISEVVRHWAPWDEQIVPTKRFHLLMCDIRLYEATLLYIGPDHVDLVPDGTDPNLVSEAYLNIAYIPATDWLFATSSAAQTLTEVQVQLAALRVRQRELHLQLGHLRETLASAFPQLAQSLNLVLRPEDLHPERANP